MSAFSHLHLHSEYSLLDGAIKLTDLVKHVKSKGMTSVALTDHGVMFGIVEFYKACKKEGIKAIIGCEVYVAARTRFDREVSFDKTSAHITLLCKNETGYRNLIRMVSLSHIEGFYFKPRIDKDLLRQYHEGLICLSGCMGGPLSRYILDGNDDAALEEAKYYQSLFGDDFYLELQDQGIEGQRLIIQKLLHIKNTLGLPVVATNDAHYLHKDDAIIQDVMIALSTGKTLKDKERLHFKTTEFYVKSTEEMTALFGFIPEAIENTQHIADQCNLELTLGKFFLPLFAVPKGETPEDYLLKVARTGLAKRYPNQNDIINDRFNFELGVINKMGFASYFLIVADFVQYAKENGIPVGPGRGSAAGSIVAYALGITDIDPLRFNLLFERFLNPDRISMPDIDIDFCIENRQKVIEYTRQKYGSDHVAQIVTFGRMAARLAIRDVGRVLEVPLSDVDKIAKLIPMGSTIAEAMEQIPELKRYYGQESFKELLDIAAKIEGTARHSGIHAAGVVISKDPLIESVPMIEKEGQLVTQYWKDDLESIGLLKMDFLGLRNLTMIDKSLRLIEKIHGIKLNMETLSLDDLDTYTLLSKGDSIGIFQLESQGMQSLLRALQPTTFEDIIALLALYRPGPLGSGMDKDFVNRKHGRLKLTYPLAEMEPILKDTYGTILYQEQVMQIASVIGGFSMSEADTLRKAMGKKDKAVMDKMKQKFIDGATEKGFPHKKVESIFDMMAKFAEYGFNKSHSAAYAYITYQTAFLKTHYPVPYMAALISSSINDTEKVSEYIAEARDMGINVLPPDINESFMDFFIINSNIMFGLGAIKNVGEGAIESIITCREEDGIFHSLIDFCVRVDLRQVNKRVLESLIKTGAFDAIGKRKSLLAIVESTLSEATKIAKDRINGQLNLFSNETTHMIEKDSQLGTLEFSRKDLLHLEKEMLGVYLSGHPLQDFHHVIKERNLPEIRTLLESGESIKNIKMIGLLTAFKKRVTKNKQSMLTGDIEDLTGVVPFVVFPQKYEEIKDRLIEEAVLLITGHVDYRNDQPQIIIDSIEPALTGVKDFNKIIITPNAAHSMEEIQALLLKNPGEVPVYFDVDGYKILLNESYWASKGSVPILEATLGKDALQLA